MNVSAVEPSIVSVLESTEVVVSGSGFTASSGVYCVVGGVGSLSTQATVVSDSEAHCVLQAAAAGMHVVEVSLNAGADMSHSGVQVEYLSASEIVSVSPSTGPVSGGTVVTLVGDGFVAGVTECAFGSSVRVMAQVQSSTEATCVSPAGVRGSVMLELTTPTTTKAMFTMVEAADVSSVEPSVVSAAGGESMVVVSSVESTGSACLFGGTVMVTAELSADGATMSCPTVAMHPGQTTVQVSVDRHCWA